jgi:hypothetical protein
LSIPCSPNAALAYYYIKNGYGNSTIPQLPLYATIVSLQKTSTRVIEFWPQVIKAKSTKN